MPQQKALSQHQNHSLKKMTSNAMPPSMRFGDKLQELSGPIEIKFKGGAFATWSDVFIRLEGRWLTVFKRERDSTRIAAIELGQGVSVTDINNHEASTKFPRRFDLFCKGGLLSSTEFGFRTKSRHDRDTWVLSIATNVYILSSIGLDLSYGVMDLDHIVTRMKMAIALHPIRIRSDLTVRCSTGQEIISFLVSERLATDREQALAIAKRLLSMNVIHHVVWEKDFVDGGEPYVIAEMTEETNYIVEHFQRYMDSRKFWKYLDSDTTSSNGSSRSATIAKSTSSSGGMSHRGSLNKAPSTISNNSGGLPNLVGPPNLVTASSYSNSSNHSSGNSSTAAAAVVDKKAKKCGVCGKSFNPLRRRHMCRMCEMVVCSSCSMDRHVESGDAGHSTARICVSCKLGMATREDDFYDNIFSAPSLANTASSSELSSISGSSRTSSSVSHLGNIQDKRSASASSVLQTPTKQKQRRASSNSVALTPGSSVAVRRNSLSDTSLTAMHECSLCMNEACAPLKDFFEVPYPISKPKQDQNPFIVAMEMDNESERLSTVDAILQMVELSASSKKTLLHFCSMAAIASQSPVAIVGLLANDEYVMCAQNGITSALTIPREQSIASHTCRNGAPLVCSDLTADVRFATNPWRRDTLQACFYAGIPLTLSNGHTIGVIEVFDTKVRFECMDVIAQLQSVVRGLVNVFEEIFAAYAETTAETASEASPVAEQLTEETKPAPMADNEMEIRLMELLQQTTSTQEQLRNQQGHMVAAISSHSKQITDLAKQLERMEVTLARKLDGIKDETSEEIAATS